MVPSGDLGWCIPSTSTYLLQLLLLVIEDCCLEEKIISISAWTHQKIFPTSKSQLMPRVCFTCSTVTILWAATRVLSWWVSLFSGLAFRMQDLSSVREEERQTWTDACLTCTACPNVIPCLGPLTLQFNSIDTVWTRRTVRLSKVTVARWLCFGTESVFRTRTEKLLNHASTRCRMHVLSPLYMPSKSSERHGCYWSVAESWSKGQSHSPTPGSTRNVGITDGHRSWPCWLSHCTEILQRMMNDMIIRRDLETLGPNAFLQLRYEDLATKPL